MLNKWYLVTLVLNTSGGNSQTIKAYDSYEEAEDDWRDALSKTGGNPSTAYMVAEILDPYGRPVAKNDYIVDKLPKVFYTVAFNSHGGSEVETQTVEAGGKATMPIAPTKDGYTFAGWELNGDPYDFDAPVTSNIVLVAQWDAE